MHTFGSRFATKRTGCSLSLIPSVSPQNLSVPGSPHGNRRARRRTLGIVNLLIAVFACAYAVHGVVDSAGTQDASQPATPLAAETFVLAEDGEVGCEIKARSVGASWRRRGAEAAALLIKVDGVYNQDLLLWAGDEPFTYRVTLGRLAAGRHVVSAELNPARSAAGARHALVTLLRPVPLLLLSSQNVDKAMRAEDALAQAYSPILFARANTIDRFTDVPLLMYYEVERPQTNSPNDLLIRYTVIFSHEDGGTPTGALMARWGRATDIEWVYELRVRDGRVVGETYQGVEHATRRFTGERTRGNHPLLAVASDNNNFSDLACSAVRYAPLPFRARLDRASRESVMDSEPWTYRLMAEELDREKRINNNSTSINSIGDPREYLYIEAYGEQKGAALAFDVRINGDEEVYRSDLNDARLRIDRSGYFRTAVRLPATAATTAVSTITARCESTTQPVDERACGRTELIKAFMLDRDYKPRPLQLPEQTARTLLPGAATTFNFKAQ